MLSLFLFTENIFLLLSTSFTCVFTMCFHPHISPLAQVPAQKFLFCEKISFALSSYSNLCFLSLYSVDFILWLQLYYSLYIVVYMCSFSFSCKQLNMWFILSFKSHILAVVACKLHTHWIKFTHYFSLFMSKV